MTFGITATLHPSLAALVDVLPVVISREALHLRFCAPAVVFMRQCIGFVIRQRIVCANRIDTNLLNQFTSIKIFDSTSWDLKPALRGVFPGSGGDASPAGCKVQLCYDYIHGTLAFFDIMPSTVNDLRYAAQLPRHIKTGELLLADLGYFHFDALARIAANGAYFVMRLLVRTALFNPLTGHPINLQRFLKGRSDDAVEIDVLAGADKRSRIRCRLICLRVDKRVACCRRRDMRKKAQKKGRCVSALRLFMAGWIIIVTNVPSQNLPAEMVRPLYGLRWQIELLFKQFKSVLAIDKSTTANQHRLCCEVIGKLIVAVLIHRIHAHFSNISWNTTRHEISFDKIYKRIRDRAFTIVTLLMESRSKAIRFMYYEIYLHLKNCRKLTQPSRPTSLQIIDKNIFRTKVTILDMEYLT